MKIAQYIHFIDEIGTSPNKVALIAANALAIELLNYGLILDEAIVARISCFAPDEAFKICHEIAKEYTVGALNPPLFKNWEQRTFFSLGELVVQIFGYIFQISGNDLQDPNFLPNLKKQIDFKKFKTITLAANDVAQKYIFNLFEAKVSQDRATFEKLVDAARYLNVKRFRSIKSDEARIAVLLSLVNNKRFTLLEGLQFLNCKAADVLRYAAAKKNFEFVKLPAETKYANLSWRERINSLSFLSNYFDFEHLSEGMGMNRAAWIKYFNHIHLLTQSDFVKRFNDVCLTFFVANGNRLEKAPEKLKENINSLIKKKIIEITNGGALAYRTFASRLQKAIEEKDFTAIEELANKRPNHILRNLTTVANGISKKNGDNFIKLIKSLIKDATPDVLFAILQINVNAKWRIIDVKGNTVVEQADYNPVIGDIQKWIEKEIYARWGYKNAVKVQAELKDNIVPFLAKNTNLARGTKFSVTKKDYLYFFVHWIQKNQRTDLDHSFICFDKYWKSEMVWFGRQSNDYIASSGDITNAPAPNGGTEYARVNLAAIPKHIKYIVPVVNVYAGENFAEAQQVKVGFWFSNAEKFTLAREHDTFALEQPAQCNMPFILDVDAGEIILLDLNLRERMSSSIHGYVETIQHAIEAVKTKYYISIGKLAEILSGSNGITSLTITNKAKSENEIAPESLFSLFNKIDLTK